MKKKKCVFCLGRGCLDCTPIEPIHWEFFQIEYPYPREVKKD